jgi:SAM-dependent methyltransferase
MQPIPAFATDALFEPATYQYFYNDILTDARTMKEVDQICQWLRLDERPRRILDLACGHGRHANELAARGHQVTGVDVSAEFLRQARDEAKKRQLRIEYVQQDMRQLDWTDRYDVAVCLFTAFGYFSDEQNEEVIHRVAKALCPGGVFLLDVQNRDAYVRRMVPSAICERDGNFMIDRHHFDVLSGRTITRRTYIRDGKQSEAPFFVRLYNLQEFQRLFDDAGLDLEMAYGDWEGSPVSLETKRLIVTARKRA